MKITLCGARRFADRLAGIDAVLTLAGHIVHGVTFASALTAEQQTLLDLVQLQKIAESDAVLVVGWQSAPADLATPDQSYVCDTTRRAMLWAGLMEKQIFGEADVDQLIEAGPMTLLRALPGDREPPTL